MFVVVQPKDKAAMLRLMADGGYTVPAMVDDAGLGRSYGLRYVPSLVVLDQRGATATSVVGEIDVLRLSRILDDLTG